MTWSEKVWRHGSMRERTFFAWKPITIRDGNIETTKWLTFVTIVEQMEYDWDGVLEWVPKQFLPK